MFEISAVQVAAVYAIVEVIRGLLPAQWLSIDGKIRVWILVTVASVAVVFQGDPPVVDTQDFLDIGVDVISLAIAAIVALLAFVLLPPRSVRIEAGPDGIKIDQDGDGKFERTIRLDNAAPPDGDAPAKPSPKKGKKITKLYLGAAGNTLGGGESVSSDGSKGKFRYTKEILSGNQAVLEFETEMDGKYVNGVDIITCDDEGRIIEFRVMIRPLQAIQTIHAQMARMLEKMKGTA